MIKNFYITGIIITMCLPITIRADQLQKNRDFSISLPATWIEIPKDVMEAYVRKISKLAPDASVPKYDYGFQLKDSGNWFAYPYILIQVSNTGRLPESQIEKLDEYSSQKDLKKQKRALSPVMSELQIGKMYYDKAEKVAWLRMESNIVGIGTINGLLGMIPTEKGFIQVYCYALKKDYATYESVFQSAITSVTPRSDLIYKPRWSDDIPPSVSGINWTKALINGIGGAIIAGMFALFGFTRKKKKT